MSSEHHFSKNQLPFFVTIPHSGEKVPDFCDWLLGLPEEVLMCDVDRYVDLLYTPALTQLHIPFVKTEWHRYAADLNRVPQDVDSASVQGNSNKAGLHNRGFHWQMTTLKTPLMTKPMSLKMHEDLVKLIYQPFHTLILSQYQNFRSKGVSKIYQLDVHSMPSMGTGEHRDPGQARAEIVVSDCRGKSSDPIFVDIVINSYVRAGFKVAYNWPYFGGRVSEQYGIPEKGQNAVQVELNRALYMDEKTKKLLPEHAEIQNKLYKALSLIETNLRGLLSI